MKKNTFKTKTGLYKWLVMPSDLTNVSKYFHAINE
jgi:hypothetical protein